MGRPKIQTLQRFKNINITICKANALVLIHKNIHTSLKKALMDLPANISQHFILNVLVALSLWDKLSSTKTTNICGYRIIFIAKKIHE